MHVKNKDLIEMLCALKNKELIEISSTASPSRFMSTVHVENKDLIEISLTASLSRFTSTVRFKKYRFD